MTHSLIRSAILMALACAMGVASTVSAATDPTVLCDKTIVKQLEKYKKTHLKLYRDCLDKENKGTLVGGPCLDLKSQTKLNATNVKVAAAIAKKCQMSHLSSLGYRSDCQYGAATAGIGGDCFALPV